METVSCNLCGSINFRDVYCKPDSYLNNSKQLFHVVECKDCGLAFVNPRPTRQEINKYYPDIFFANRAEEDKRYIAEIAFLKKRYKHLSLPWGEGQRMLDIGTANGDFPYKMQLEGWSCAGLEPSPNSVPINGIPIYNCDLPDIPEKNGTFNLITSWAVFEHLHDPMSYFRKVNELLCDRGVFVFLVTNWDSIASKCLMSEDIPRHLYFYCEKTVAKYLSINKMALIHHETNDKIYKEQLANCVPFFLKKIVGHEFSWNDLPESYKVFLIRKQRQRSFFSRLAYWATHPVNILDKAVCSIIKPFQMINKTYQISVYVAMKIS